MRGAAAVREIPGDRLGVPDLIALIVGIVVGVGIFRTPSVIAANAESPSLVLLAWVAGGFISLAGALCYAELTATYPHAGGDYHYLSRAFGRRLSFLFAWARLTVLQTGSIALLAFVLGDYATQVLPLGTHSSAIYAGAVIVVLTVLNAAGIRHGTLTQNVLTVLAVAGLLLVTIAGLVVAPAAPATGRALSGLPSASAIGLVMVFVLLSYGGWNEAAYVSAEVREPRRNMVRGLVGGITVVTVLYLLINAAYLRGLGLERMAASPAVAADLLHHAFGATGAQLVTLLVAAAAVTSANATVITGARTAYALGRDMSAFGWLGRWHAGAGTPVNALLAQGAFALTLVILGGLTRRGFETMVEYTAPVFWTFFLLTGLSLFVLRRREAHVERPFRVPLYPVTPLLFCASSAYLLYSSLAYTGVGALVGLGVLGCGMLLLLALRTDRAPAGAPAS